MSDNKQLDKSFSLTSREQAREFGAAPPPDDKKKVDPNAPRCVGCGRYHGGVNVKLNCLSSAIRQRDQQIATLKTEIASLNLRLRLERDGKGPNPAVEAKPEKA